MNDVLIDLAIHMVIFLIPLVIALVVFCVFAANLWNGVKKTYKEYAQKSFLENSGGVSGNPPPLGDILLSSYLEEEKKQASLASGSGYSKPLTSLGRDEFFSSVPVAERQAMTEDVFSGRQVVDEFEELRKHAAKTEKRLQSRISGEVLWDDVVSAHAKHIDTLPAKVREQQ